ncbi:hypothetical protein MKW92_007169, partial [Papaver armeniacum]
NRVFLRFRKISRRNLTCKWMNNSAMDNSAIQSQRSVSSISTSNQTLDSQSGACSTSNPPEFVNHGLLLWNRTTQQWIENRNSGNPTPQVQELRLR